MWLRPAEGAVECVTSAAGGLGDQLAIQIYGGRDELVTQPAGNLRDRDAFGETKLVNVCRRSWKVVSVGNPATLIADSRSPCCSSRATARFPSERGTARHGHQGGPVGAVGAADAAPWPSALADARDRGGPAFPPSGAVTGGGALWSPSRRP